MTTAVAPAPARLLYRAALALFTITIVIGILNGTDLVRFDRNALLTHLHAGTLGWITLGVLGTLVWVFYTEDATASSGRVLAWLSVGTIGLYIIGFWTGDRVLRPIAGSAALIPIVGGVLWAFRRKVRVTGDTVRMGLVLALVSLSIGGVLGILWGLSRTGVIDWIPPEALEAHPPQLIAGFVFLAGAVLAEWLLVGDDGTERTSRLGQVHVWLIFAAGMLMGGGLVLDLPLLSLLGLPVSVVAVALIPTRMRSRIRSTSWSRPSSARYASSGIIWLVAAFVVFGYMSAAFPEAFPHYLTVVFFHALFVGGLTNILLGVVRRAARDLRPARALGETVYWGLNGGLLLFIAGLFADSTALIRVGTPIFGLALILGVVVYVLRLGDQFVPRPVQPALYRLFCITGTLGVIFFIPTAIFTAVMGMGPDEYLGVDMGGGYIQDNLDNSGKVFFEAMFGVVGGLEIVAARRLKASRGGATALSWALLTIGTGLAVAFVLPIWLILNPIKASLVFVGSYGTSSPTKGEKSLTRS